MRYTKKEVSRKWKNILAQTKDDSKQYTLEQLLKELSPKKKMRITK